MEDHSLIDIKKRLYDEFNLLNRQRFASEIEKYSLRFSQYSARTHGRIDFGKKEIMISLPMYEQYGWEAVRMTLLHEMTHALIHQRGGQARHTKRFWHEFEKRGGVREKIDVKPKNPYVYACPTCGQEIERMRRIKRPWLHSCSICDKSYNPRHRLFLKKDKSKTC